MKQLIFTILLFVIGFNITGQNLEDLSFGTDSTLEVVTWNMEFFPTNGQTTIDYVKQIINALDADVIALQEIDQYNSFVSMLDELDGWEGVSTNTGYLNLAYIYNPETVQMTSVYPILNSHSRELPRKPLVMEMIYNGNEFVLINNHLKCCGDGYMDTSDAWDEETRRYDACVLMDQYIEDHFADKNVILLGDLNDILTDDESNNVFQVFFDDPENYLFADLAIAEGPSSDWSYPSWPSHLDHILISNELFDEFEAPDAEILTLRIDDYLENGFWEYEQNVSDHRPVGLKIKPAPGSAGIHDHELPTELSISPNPCNGSATFHFDPVPAGTSIGIFNLSGQLLSSIKVQPGTTSASFNTGNLPAGIYQVSLITDQQIVATQKLIVVEY